MTTWQPMSTAPRNGTIIEIECRYGVKPWRRLHKWSNVRRMEIGGEIRELIFDEPSWVSIPNEANSIAFENSCVWRPWSGPIEEFHDPLAGFDEYEYYTGGRPPGYHPDMPSRRRPVKQSFNWHKLVTKLWPRNDII